jgi:thiol-disulfide isomerase/thioredoxin
VVKARFDRHGPDGEVVDLSETNFDEVVGRGTPVLVKVYAEWCKHCVALAPVWGEVARELEGELFVGRVDGPKNRLLLKRIGAKAYPTIALFKNGKMYEYESGDRSVAAIVSFARKDYRKTKARGFFHAVWFSKGLRLLYAVPAIGEKAYAYLHRDLRLSNVAILFLTLCVPVMAGMFAIFVADMMICRGVLQETRAMYRNGNRGGGENAGGAPRRPHFD